MTKEHFITGPGKVFLYVRIASHVLLLYAMRPHVFHWSPVAYVQFLMRALRLLLIFRHNKVVRVFNGYKLHLYLPAYPSPAFFYAIETKLLRRPAGPTTIVYSITKACTYKCPHCYQNRDGGADLSEELLLQTARKIQDIGIAMFDIEGGEPFLRYSRLLRLVQALDSRSELWINTTGAHMRPEMLEELKGAGLFGLMVSIHSPDAETHDAFTGIQGSFELACDTLKLCRKMGLVAAFNTVLSEEDVLNGGLDKLMRLGLELDCDYIQLIHPKPAGTWMTRTEGMQRDSSLIDFLRDEHVRYNSSSRRSYPSLAAQVFEESPSVLGCTAGAVDRFYVNANGEVQPCEFLNISFGNVNEESFEEIYSRMRSHFKVPCCDWLCCSLAEGINELIDQNELTHTPLPWPLTRELIDKWDRGRTTPVYEKLGIYR